MLEIIVRNLYTVFERHGDRMNINFGAKLAEIRREKDISQKDLAEELSALGIHVTNQAVSKWEKGATQPNADQFLALCCALGIDNISECFLGKKSGLLHGLNSAGTQKVMEYADILRASGLYREENALINPRVLPLYGLAVSAGTGQFLDSSDYENIEVDDSVPLSASFGVRVSGNSMHPKFEDGQIVWVKQQQTLKNGEIGVFLYDDNAYLKKLCSAHGGISLISINPEYSDIIVTEEKAFRVLGKALV